MARCRPALRGIFLWLLLAVAAPAFAQSEPNFDRYFEAADRLDRLASEALQRGGPPPRLSDPQVAALFPDITQAARVFDRPPYGAEALAKLLEVTQRSTGLMLLYVEWGSSASDSAATRARSGDRNMVLYQEEVVPILVFTVDVSSVVLGSMMRTLEAMGTEQLTDVQRRGIATSRQGITHIVAGLTHMMLYPGLAPERQLALANTLAVNGRAFAGALTLSQRRAAAMMIQIARDRGAGPQIRAALARAVEAFSIAGCEGLCAL